MFHLAGIAGSYAEQDLTRKIKSAAELVQKARAEKAARDEALAVIERWNGELASGTGRAGVPWLDVFCRGCRTSGRSIFGR